MPKLHPCLQDLIIWRCGDLMVSSLTGLEVNFLVHLQSLAGQIFSTSKLIKPPAKFFPKCLGDMAMDDSNSQMFPNWIFFSLANNQNNSYFASLRALISALALWIERFWFEP